MLEACSVGRNMFEMAVRSSMVKRTMTFPYPTKVDIVGKNKSEETVQFLIEQIPLK